jgi:hypothetical protein
VPLPGPVTPGTVAFVDVDDTIRTVHGHAKQGAGYGYTKVNGLNAQLAVLSWRECAPVIAAARLRKGNVYSPHVGPRMSADAVAAARAAGVTGQILVRADAAYYSEAFMADVSITAVTSRPSYRPVPCRLVVRRVARPNEHATDGQDELFTSWRYHAFIPNNDLSPVTAICLTPTTHEHV